MPSHSNSSSERLIDFATSHPHDDSDLDVSDEEDAFYARENDALLSPKWRARFTHVAQRVRVPRRLQRYFVIYLVCFVVLIVGWFGYLGPYVSRVRRTYREMNDNPHDRFGLNRRPEFKDLIQVQQLDPRHLPKGDARLVVVGDVHGCKAELDELLEKVGFESQRDHLILTGDMVSKGPDSGGVITLAANLNASSVRGNHEDRLLLSHATPPPPSEKTSHASFAAFAATLSNSQLSYLSSLPVILDVGPIGKLQHVVVVHAGLVPDLPLAEQDPFQVMNMRTIHTKTRRPTEYRTGVPWEKFWNHYQKKRPEGEERWSVIYGHDKKRGFNVKEWSFGLDSGCVSGGELTAMVIDEAGGFEFVHVKCKGYVKKDE